MMRFRERNQVLLGAVSLGVILLVVIGALNSKRLPILNHNSTYSADFENSGGLQVNDNVSVAGVNIGTVTGMHLAGNKVNVKFAIDHSVHLGTQTTAAAKVLSVVGSEYLELAPAGSGRLSDTIPVSRTTVPYTFVDSLQTLATTQQGYDIPAIVKSLQVGREAISSTTSADTTAALTNLARLSSVLAERKDDLATLVTQGAGVTKTLADNSGQLVDLVSQGDVVLQVLQQRRAALQQLFTGTTQLSQELITLVGGDNRNQLKSLLSNLQTVSQLLARDSANIDAALPLLGAFSKYAANAAGTGPFIDTAIPTMLLPDAFLNQCKTGGAAAYPATSPQAAQVVGCRP